MCTTSARAAHLRQKHQARPIDNQLVEAVKALDADRVETLLGRGADPNYVWVNPVHIVAAPVLYFALKAGKNPEDRPRARQIIKLLVDAGGRLGPEEPSGMMLMSSLIAASDEEPICMWLEAGGNINAAGPTGITYLMAAAESCRRPMVAFLLAHGADPCVKDVNGATAADYAKRAVGGERACSETEAAAIVGLVMNACAVAQPN
jgi:hypothetical protein